MASSVAVMVVEQGVGVHLTWDLVLLLTSFLPWVVEVVVPLMMAVQGWGVVVEGVGHQQTTDVVCLLMIMDSLLLIIFLLQNHAFHLWNLF